MAINIVTFLASALCSKVQILQYGTLELRRQVLGKEGCDVVVFFSIISTAPSFILHELKVSIETRHQVCSFLILLDLVQSLLRFFVEFLGTLGFEPFIDGLLNAVSCYNFVFIITLLTFWMTGYEVTFLSFSCSG